MFADDGCLATLQPGAAFGAPGPGASFIGGPGGGWCTPAAHCVAGGTGDSDSEDLSRAGRRVGGPGLRWWAARDRAGAGQCCSTGLTRAGFESKACRRRNLLVGHGSLRVVCRQRRDGAAD